MGQILHLRLYASKMKIRIHTYYNLVLYLIVAPNISETLLHIHVNHYYLFQYGYLGIF